MEIFGPLTVGGPTHGVFGEPVEIPQATPTQFPGARSREFDQLAAHTGPHHAAGSFMAYLDPPLHFHGDLPAPFEAEAERSGPMSPIRPGGR